MFDYIRSVWDNRSVPGRARSAIGGVSMKKVAIVMGSDSDLGTMRKAVEKLKSLEIPAEL